MNRFCVSTADSVRANFLVHADAESLSASVPIIASVLQDLRSCSSNSDSDCLRMVPWSLELFSTSSTLSSTQNARLTATSALDACAFRSAVEKLKSFDCSESGVPNDSLCAIDQLCYTFGATVRSSYDLAHALQSSSFLPSQQSASVFLEPSAKRSKTKKIAKSDTSDSPIEHVVVFIGPAPQNMEQINALFGANHSSEQLTSWTQCHEALTSRLCRSALSANAEGLAELFDRCAAALFWFDSAANERDEALWRVRQKAVECVHKALSTALRGALITTGTGATQSQCASSPQSLDLLSFLDPEYSEVPLVYVNPFANVDECLLPVALLSGCTSANALLRDASFLHEDVRSAPFDDVVMPHSSQEEEAMLRSSYVDAVESFSGSLAQPTMYIVGVCDEELFSPAISSNGTDPDFICFANYNSGERSFRELLMSLMTEKKSLLVLLASSSSLSAPLSQFILNALSDVTAVLYRISELAHEGCKESRQRFTLLSQRVFGAVRKKTPPPKSLTTVCDDVLLTARDLSPTERKLVGPREIHVLRDFSLELQQSEEVSPFEELAHSSPPSTPRAASNDAIFAAIPPTPFSASEKSRRNSSILSKLLSIKAQALDFYDSIVASEAGISAATSAASSAVASGKLVELVFELHQLLRKGLHYTQESSSTWQLACHWGLLIEAAELRRRQAERERTVTTKIREFQVQTLLRLWCIQHSGQDPATGSFISSISTLISRYGILLDLQSQHHCGMTRWLSTVVLPNFAPRIPATVCNLFADLHFVPNDSCYSYFVGEVGEMALSNLLKLAENDFEICSSGSNSSSVASTATSTVAVTNTPSFFDVLKKQSSAFRRHDSRSKRRVNNSNASNVGSSSGSDDIPFMLLGNYTAVTSSTHY